MSGELKEGVHLEAIIGMPDEEGAMIFRVGDEDDKLSVKSITVTMEHGQMAGVPWARVESHGGKVSLVNLANVELVELAGDQS